MKWLIALAFALIGAPVAAQAQDMETVGPWKISGKGGDCIAGLMTPNGMLMIVSPASTGENQGGMMIAKADLTVVEGPGQLLDFSGLAGWEGKRAAIGYPDMPGYWTAFPSATTIDAFPDSWRFNVTKDGAPVVDLQVTGFAAARTALRACVVRTK